MEKVNLFFPEKTIKMNENDKPWMNPTLLKIDRKRKRIYNKEMKSEKWKSLNAEFQKKESDQKIFYYENIVEHLKT